MKKSNKTGRKQDVNATGPSSRELWLNAVKSNSGGMASGYNNTAGYTNKRTPSEYWQDTLRKSGAAGPKSQTFSGLRSAPGSNMGYLSTSQYMRELVSGGGGDKAKMTGSQDSTGGRSSKGTPAYKSQEEYYDEILELRKQIAAVGNENTTLKSRIRRLEDDNLRKEKEMDQLLNPGTGDDLRRTLSDRKAENGATVHGMKQKNLKLEQQLKEKEAALSKLQSDLKTTKVDEMKLQLEAFYQEVVRLKHTSIASADRGDRRSKENPSKVKALNDTIIRINEKNVRLTSENRTLKEDLEKMLEDLAKYKDKQGVYTKQESWSSADKKRKDVDTQSLTSLDDKHRDTAGKMQLSGSLAERLEQLDQRETGLLEENEKQRAANKRLREDRQHYRSSAENKTKEMKSLKKEVEILQTEVNSFYDRDKYPTPRSARDKPPTPQVTPRGSVRKRSTQLARRPSTESLTSQVSERDRQGKMKEFRENRAAKNIQKNWKTHQHRKQERALEEARVKEQTHFREKHAATTIQRGWRSHHREEASDRKVTEFRENRAARKIQRGWVDHRHRKQEHDTDDATTLIQSAWKGHRTRKAQISRYHDDEDEESDLDGAVMKIQSAYRGHRSRRDNTEVLSATQSRRPSSGDRRHSKPVRNGLDSEGEEGSDYETRSRSDSAKRSSINRKDSGQSRRSSADRNTKRKPSRPQTPVAVSDDDDDICF